MTQMITIAIRILYQHFVQMPPVFACADLQNRQVPSDKVADFGCFMGFDIDFSFFVMAERFGKENKVVKGG